MKHKQAGFTLIEVLIALVIAAISLAALSRALGVSSNNQVLLEDKVVATWVAENALVQEQISSGKAVSSSEITMLGRDWQVKRSLQNTLLPDFKKIVIEVSPKEGYGDSKNATARLISVVGAE